MSKFLYKPILFMFLLAFSLGNVFAQKSGCFSFSGKSTGVRYETIVPCGATKITLTFYYFNATTGSLLKVYDGPNALGKHLHSSSGFTNGNIPTGAIIASSGALYLYFTTNGTSSTDSIYGCWTADIDTAKPVANLEIQDTLYYFTNYTYVNTSKHVEGMTDFKWSIYPTYGTVGYKKELNWAFNQTGKYDVTLEVATCKGKSSKVRSVVVINPEDKVNLDFKANNTHPELDELDTLTAINFLTKKRPIAADRFFWKFSPNAVTYENGTSPNSPTVQVKFKQSGKYTVSLLAWNSSDSASTASEVIKNNYIEVNAPLIKQVFLDIVTKNSKPKASLVDTLYAIDSVKGRLLKANRFRWEFNPNSVTYVNGTTASDKQIQVVFNEVGKYSVSLHGWHSSDSAATENDTTKVDFITVLDPPWAKVNIDFFASATKLKINQIINLDVPDTINGMPLKANKFKWKIVPDEVVYLSGTNPSMKSIHVKLIKKGHYSVTLSAWNDADSINSFNDTTKTNYLIVKEQGQDQVSLDFIATNLTPTPGQIDTLMVLDTIDGKPYKANRFIWEFAPATVEYVNGTTPFMSTIQVIIKEPKVYSVRLNGWNTIDSTETFNSIFKLDYIFAVQLGAVNPSNKISNLVVYPNPFQGLINLNYQPTESGRIQIFNSLGKLVYKDAIFTKNQSIDLSGQADGIYHLRLMNDNNQIIDKVTIVKQN